MHDQLVSVIIPTYNGVESVLNAVHTVAAQSYGNIETIIVIDGSDDGTLELLESYKATLPDDQQDNFQIIFQENGGVSSARNTGMAAANGEYIALLDDDDSWHPDKIQTQMNAVSNLPQQTPVFCTTDHEVLNINSGDTELKSNGKSLSFIGLMENTGAQPGTWLFSRSVYEQIGGFDEQMSVAEDGDFILRVLQEQNIALLNVDQPLTTYRVGNEDSLSSGPLTQGKIDSFLRALERYHDLWKQELPDPLYQNYMNWFRETVPEDQLNETLQRIGNSSTAGLDLQEGSTTSFGRLTNML